MHGGLFICRSLCTCAPPRVYWQRALHVCTAACLFCKGPCICAERRAGLHASVLVCSAACLFCTSTCTRARGSFNRRRVRPARRKAACASQSASTDGALETGPTRLELATSGVTGRRSSQLNYDPEGKEKIIHEFRRQKNRGVFRNAPLRIVRFIECALIAPL